MEIDHLVSQRSRDIAVRIALGARVRDIVNLVVTEGMTLVAVGIAIALVARFLVEVEPLDFGAWAVSVLILTASAAIATAVPARRSARIDPITSLRAD